MNSFSSTRVNDLKSADAWPSGGALVVTATFNERDNIDLLIEKVLATDPTIQLLVIDDDSPDQTGIHAMLLATQNARLHVLVRRGRRGLGSAIEEGFREASRRGFFVAVNIDGDLSHDPADIPRLLVAFDKPPAIDVVIGSRRLPNGGVIGWPISRHISSFLVCFYARWILRIPVRDASSGFRAVRLACFDRLGDHFTQGYAFHEELLWRIARAGGSFVEIPITFTNRGRGTSKAGWIESLRAIRVLLRLAGVTWLLRNQKSPKQ